MLLLGGNCFQVPNCCQVPDCCQFPTAELQRELRRNDADLLRPKGSCNSMLPTLPIANSHQRLPRTDELAARQQHGLLVIIYTTVHLAA